MSRPGCALLPSPSLLPRLGLGVAPLLEKNLEFLNDCLDDIMVEQGKLSMYQNQLRRQQQAIAQFKVQRRQENLARRAAGAWAGLEGPEGRRCDRCSPTVTALGALVQLWHGPPLHRSDPVLAPYLPGCPSPFWPAPRAAPTGEEPLSEDPPEGMFKPVAEPNQLDNMLLSNQMASYCQHINSATQQALSKLTLMEGLQRAL